MEVTLINGYEIFDEQLYFSPGAYCWLLRKEIKNIQIHMTLILSILE